MGGLLIRAPCSKLLTLRTQGEPLLLKGSAALTNVPIFMASQGAREG